MLYSKWDLRTQWRVRIISLELLVKESDAAQDAAGLSDVGAHCCLRHRLSFKKKQTKKSFLILSPYPHMRIPDFKNGLLFLPQQSDLCSMVFNSPSETPQVKHDSQSLCALKVVNYHQQQMVETSFAQIQPRDSLFWRNGNFVCQNSAQSTPECPKSYCTSFLFKAVCSKWLGEIIMNLRKLKNIATRNRDKNQSRRLTRKKPEN